MIPFPPDQVKRTGKSSCYQCGVDCLYRNRLRTASGEEVVRKCQSMFVYFQWVAGRPEESAETAVKATGICNDLSLCTIEMFNIINWLSACDKAGCLTEKQTGLNMSQLGTLDFFHDLASMIAERKGFGDILAEGLLRAAVHIIDRTCTKDSLVLCDSIWPLMVSWHTPDRVGEPSLESRIFTAVTGIEADEKELNAYGERIFNLERAIMIREGKRPLTDDDVAEFNYTQPVRTVFMNPDVLVPGPGDQVLSRKGMVLGRKDFQQMRK